MSTRLTVSAEHGGSLHRSPRKIRSGRSKISPRSRAWSNRKSICVPSKTEFSSLWSSRYRSPSDGFFSRFTAPFSGVSSQPLCLHRCTGDCRRQCAEAQPGSDRDGHDYRDLGNSAFDADKRGASARSIQRIRTSSVRRTGSRSVISTDSGRTSSLDDWSARPLRPRDPGRGTRETVWRSLEG